MGHIQLLNTLLPCYLFHFFLLFFLISRFCGINTFHEHAFVWLFVWGFFLHSTYIIYDCFFLTLVIFFPLSLCLFCVEHFQFDWLGDKKHSRHLNVSSSYTPRNAASVHFFLLAFSLSVLFPPDRIYVNEGDAFWGPTAEKLRL